jgi:hypothetical protein
MQALPSRRRASFSPRGASPSDSCGIAEVEGRGTPNDSMFCFQEPFGVPAVRVRLTLRSHRKAASRRVGFRSPRPDRSGTFGVLWRSRPSALPASFGRPIAPRLRRLAALRRSDPSALPSSAPSSREERPRRSTGRSDLGRDPPLRKNPEPASRPPSPEFGVNPGRRRRPRPTSRRLMSAPLGWTGHRQLSTSRSNCQAYFPTLNQATIVRPVQ